MNDTLIPVAQDVTAGLVRAYSELTEDFNPIHTDAEFAATTPMGRPIAHGTLSLALIWRSLELSLGAAALAGATLDVRFAAPVWIGDTVQAGGRRLADGGYEIWVSNQRGDKTITGTFRRH
jgi:3-hydroxybutyryl-CoA dehydratase